MIRPRFLAIVAAVGFAVSAAAFAQEAFTTRTANVRAGPAPDFPLVASLAPGTPVNIDGCVNDYLWCDVDFGAGRGWVSARSLQTYYQNRVVPLYGYGSTLGLPIVTFSLFNYWDSYYRNRPFYRDRPRFEQRWGGNDRPRADFGRPGSDYGRPRQDYPRQDYRQPRVEQRPPQYVQPRQRAEQPNIGQPQPNAPQMQARPNQPQVQQVQPRQDRPQGQQPRRDRTGSFEPNEHQGQ